MFDMSFLLTLTDITQNGVQDNLGTGLIVFFAIPVITLVGGYLLLCLFEAVLEWGEAAICLVILWWLGIPIWGIAAVLNCDFNIGTAAIVAFIVYTLAFFLLNRRYHWVTSRKGI